MSLGEAVRSVLQQNYANFSGRARRSEYWYWTLATIILGIVVRIVGLASSALYIVLILVEVVALIVPGLAVSVRRLHDTGKTGWWLFIGLVPLVGFIVLIVFLCQDSQPDNKYGPSPKSIGGGYSPDPAYPPAQ